MAHELDSLNSRMAQALRATLRTVALVLAVVLAAMALTPGSVALELFAVGAGLAVALALLPLLRRGHVQLTAYVIVFALIAVAAVAAGAFGSVRAIGSVGFLAAVIAGGMFLGGRGIALAAGVSAAAVCLLIYLENAGLLPAPNYRVGPAHAIILSGAIGGTAAMLYYARRLLLEAVSRARQSEERFRLAFDSSPIGMTITRLSDGKFLAVNRMDHATLGYAREEVLGRSSVESSWLSAEDRARFVEQLRAHGRVLNYPARMRRKDGRIADCALWAAVVEIDGEACVLTSAINVTESKRTADELHASRRLLEQVIDAIPMSIFAKDLDSNYVMVNRQMAEFFGTTKAQLLKQHTRALPSTEATRTESLRNDRRVFEGRRAIEHVTWTENAAGTPVPFHTSKIPLFDERGELTGLLGINRDITEQREAQRRIEEANATLEARVHERTAQLEAANRELEAFSYSVSHDLKAPLRSIDGAAGMLRIKFGAQLPEGSETYLERISRSARQMGRLIEGLLEFARLSRQALDRQALRPDDIVGAVLQDHEEAIRERGVVLELRALPRCHADPLLLRQVYENLVSNALKYSAHARPARIEIGAREEGGDTVYYVRDNGVGFDMAYAHKLGGVFERLHPPGQFEGTGIGLALARRIVERHGGRLWADSRPGEGAIFHFTLPLAA
jgi:PAS domain S-box-containing protein